ncbi:hypothetical protein PCE1_004519 [Barthelona sp. PCE]
MNHSARKSGKAARDDNIKALSAIFNILKSTLGPRGLDKMLINEVGDIEVSNDGAFILKSLRLVHPIAQTIQQTAEQQDSAVGDGTTSATLVACELVKVAGRLQEQGLHPSFIIKGYRMASELAVAFVNEQLAVNTTDLGPAALSNVARTTLSSKIIGASQALFCNIVVNAIESVKIASDFFGTTYPIRNIGIVKIHGKSLTESELVNGYCLPCGKAADQMPSYVDDAKIAFLDFALMKARLKIGIQVLVSDADKLEGIRQREINILKERVEMILASGANVILTTGGIDEIAMKYFVESGSIAVRRVAKPDLRRLAKATGGSIITTLADEIGNESFDSVQLGTCDEVVCRKLGDKDVMFFKGTKHATSASIVLRGPNEQTLDEAQRSIHDALCAVRRALTSDRVVAGGGSVESALHVYLENEANKISGREQLAVLAFAEALLTIPKTLASNAALDATELTAQLVAYQAEAQKEGAKKEVRYAGLDLDNDTVTNNLSRGVLEPALAKTKYLEYATEAAITVLRVDTTVTLPAREEAQK